MALDARQSVEIEPLLGAEYHARSAETSHGRRAPRLIPLERKKRKRSESSSSGCPDRTGPGPIPSGASLPTKTIESEPALTLVELLSKPLSDITDSLAFESPDVVETTPAAVSVPPVSSKQDEPPAERSESPPMRILSVRSLADNTSYLYDSQLGERIPFSAGPEETADGQPPLYIFNPVKRVSDSVGAHAQNDFQPVGNGKNSKEISSEVQTPINANNDPVEHTGAPKPATHVPRQPNHSYFLEEIRTSSVQTPTSDKSLKLNGHKKVSRDVEPESETTCSRPVVQDAPPSVGKSSYQTSKTHTSNVSPAENTKTSIRATHTPSQLNLSYFFDEIGTSAVKAPTSNTSLTSNDSKKVSRDVEPESENRCCMLVTQDTPPSVGKDPNHVSKTKFWTIPQAQNREYPD